MPAILFFEATQETIYSRKFEGGETMRANRGKKRTAHECLKLE
jgi:hypothetical protein